MEIILASGSYKRREIMEKSGIPFRVEVPEIDEHAFDDLPTKERVMEIARNKAINIAERFPQDIIISADSLAEESESRQIQYKPRDIEEGLKLAMLSSGATINGYTGICMIHPEFGEVTEVAVTVQKFIDFSEEELKRLVDEQFLQRAGALGISEETAGYTLVESISGSYTGAFGLPMEIVRKYLKKWQVI
ncbi:MAG: Maf family protein [Patescibacteria group bacterium]|jgi:septum formation protein